MDKSVLTMAPRPLAVSRKGLTTVILTLTAKEHVIMSQNRHFQSVNEQSTAGVVSYNCIFFCISKVKSTIRGLAVEDLGMTLGASHGRTSILEALKKRTNTLQYLVT